MSVETLRKEIQELESDIEGLQEKIKTKSSDKATAIARVQARLFLEIIFAPYMDGLCGGWGVSPEEGLRRLITQKSTLDKIAADNPAELMVLMSTPELQKIIEIASPLGNVSDEWVNEKMGILFEVMVDIRPELARIIVDTPGGREWFFDSLTGLKNILFSEPQLKY